jgi:hypothetical protein
MVALDEPWRGTAAPRAMLLVMGRRSVILKRLVAAAALKTAKGRARVLEKAVRDIAARARGYPRTLLVSGTAVAERVGAALAPHQVEVRTTEAFRGLRQTIRRLATQLDIPDLAWDMVPLGWPWEKMDPAHAAHLFPAAARLWLARPWDRLPEEHALLARWQGRDGVVVLTWPKAHGHLVTLFTDVRDYCTPGLDSPEHAVLGIRYVDSHALPRTLRRQVMSAGWEVAEPGAYPLLVVGGSAEGAVGAGDVAFLGAAARAGAAWVKTSRGLPSALPFHHPESGVELRPDLDVDAVPWPVMGRARPGCATGPGAGLAADGQPPAERMGGEAQRAAAFGAGLRAGGVREGLARRYAEAAAEWARFLDGHARISAGAATEYDLRLFLYGWYPLHARGSEEEAERMPASLRRYIGWLRDHEGITYPWAQAVLRERDAYRERLETAPLGGGGELGRWRQHLYRDLDARVLLRDRGFPDPGLAWWERPSSPRVAALTDELQRLWLRWRDEAVAAGTTAPGPLRAVLLARQREWERTAHPAFGASPIRVAAEDGPVQAG